MSEAGWGVYEWVGGFLVNKGLPGIRGGAGYWFSGRTEADELSALLRAQEQSMRDLRQALAAAEAARDSLSNMLADRYEQYGQEAAIAADRLEALGAAYQQTHDLAHPLFMENGEPIPFEHCSLYVCKKNREKLAAHRERIRKASEEKAHG